MKRTYKIKNWIKKFRLTPKEQVNGKELIIFKNKKLAEEFGEKYLTPNKNKKDS